MEKFRLLIDGKVTAFENMARDELLLRQVIRGNSPPALRFYGWAPPALSLGYLQRSGDEVDAEMCALRGVDLVRRPTGGKAVLHDDELTYSVIIPADHEAVEGKGVVDSYRAISRALVKGLELCGLPATMAPEEVKRTERAHTNVCFDSPSSYEVMVSRKKLIGSAQMRDKGVILQHGSVPIDWDPDKIFDVMGIPPGEGRKKSFRVRFLNNATSIYHELGRRLSFADLILCFARGFEEVFGIELARSEYGEEERRMADRLVEEKYSTDAWTFLR